MDSGDESDDPPLKRPRLSLPIDEDEDELRPPRLSQIDDESYTVQSIELPRRAISEHAASRLSRGSLGSVRVSDYFDNDELTEDGGRQSDFFPGLLDDLQAQAGMENATLERLVTLE